MVEKNVSDLAVADAHAAESNVDAVAIVGMALRVPGALSLEKFWENLRDGVESTTFFSDQQLRAVGVPEAALRDPAYVKAFGALEGADAFDAGFFDLPPREAEILDPQHRQLLECAWEALEHAGYAPGSDSFAAAGRIGVMAGVGLNTYLLQNLMGRSDLVDTLGAWQISLSNDKDFAATRVAYKLDLRGVALNVSTACSTSLVSTAMACQSLLSWQCDMILAGGCSIHTPQDQGYWHHPGGTLSPDGRCRAFDVQAQGTFDGNGVAMVALKRLDDAIRDGDTIHAVIRGFAINNDGAVKVGYTAPGVEGQASVIREAQEMAGVSADTIGYVETHGTGTDLGDLVEVSALKEAFRRSGVPAKQQCALGSVKTNVGHLDTAAGTTSLIKTALGLSHGQIPPTLHYTRPNPKLALEDSPFYVNAALRAWPHLGGAPRRAGVSSFGIGGTNAHVIVEQAPPPAASDAGRAWHLLPISARSPVALQNNVDRFAAHVRMSANAQTNISLADTAYTLQLGRRAFAQRHVILACDATDAIATLDASRSERMVLGSAAEQAPPVVFLFPGQDAQYAGMARTLYRDEPLFRREVDACAASVRRTHGIDLNARLFSDSATTDPTFASDPLPLFVVEYALARFWMALGVQPRAMLGYSLGEYVCACVAGVLSLDDALSLAVEGARLLSLLTPGPLLAVSLPESELRALIPAALASGLGVAMISAPRQCVVGGHHEAIAALKETLTAVGASFVTIPLGLPFHTQFMAPFLAAYRASLNKVSFSTPKIPYISCVTGDWIRPEQATDPEHYLRLAGQTVHLAQGFETLFSVKDAVFLELGPGQIMASFVLLQQGRPAHPVVLSSLRDPRFSAIATQSAPATDLLALLTTVARLWTGGLDINWSALYRDERRQRVPLPRYAFEHQRYWIDPATATPVTATDTNITGKQAALEKWFYLPTWRELPPLSQAAITGRWLVVGARSGLAPSLTERLRAAGCEAVLHCLDDGAITIAADWDRLLDRTEQGQRFDQVVYLGLLDQADNHDDDGLLTAGFYALLALGQSLGRRVFSGSMTLTLIANGLYPVGEATLAPANAAVLGPLSVLPQEYPNLQCRIIDVFSPESEPIWQRTRLLNDLLAEFAGAERAVAVRSGRRWVERFEPYPLSAPGGAAGDNPFKSGGVYLITGGVGHIGLALAQRIAQRAPGAHLILTSRQPQSALAPAQLAQVKALEALGAVVRIATADVTDVGVMAKLIADIESDYGALNGVIHAAGVVGKASFATVGESSPAFCQTQLNPKLRGARVLEKVLGQRPLDFCVLCSSLSPILGGLGFTAYAAANASLDAFACEHNRRHPVRWTSINWEGWQFDPAAHESNQLGAAVAELGLLPAEGVDAFERILVAPHADRIVLSTGELSQRLRQWIDLNRIAPQSTHAVSTTRHARPQMLGPYAAPVGPIAQAIAQLWENLLGIDGIGADDSFFELGGNSLLLTQLLAQIRKTFRLELSLTALFERPTIADSAQLIEAALAARTTQTQVEREEGLL